MIDTMIVDRNIDLFWMKRAIDLARRCPPAQGAFSVGAVIVSEDNQELSFGYSRESDLQVHAEESAIGKLDANDNRLAGTTIYSTLEPCSQRASRPTTCTQHILRVGISRVVIAWLEPGLFVRDAQGSEILTSSGVVVDSLPELAVQAMEPNAHLDLNA